MVSIDWEPCNVDRPPLGDIVQLPRNFRVETEVGKHGSFEPHRYLLVWETGADHTVLMDITEYQMKLLLHGGVPPAGARIERG